MSEFMRLNDNIGLFGLSFVNPLSFFEPIWQRGSRQML